MYDKVPEQPKNSVRITIELNSRVSRMDNTLLEALKKQSGDIDLKNISRSGLKALFTNGLVQIKGQRAKPSSALAVGTTYVDILKAETAKAVAE
ncbi:MAG: hypothetical protein H7328_01365 [Bdellovibrio sp.]|nr:hypothetical protein [Bdellovibrio sp.]